MTTNCLTYGNLALAANEAAYVPTLPSAISHTGFRVIDGGAGEAIPQASRGVSFLVKVASIVSLLTLAVFLVTVGSQTFIHVSTIDRLDSIERTSITVMPGDTLWDIASDHAVSGVSTADMVRMLKDWNDLSSGSLQTGTTLVVAG